MTATVTVQKDQVLIKVSGGLNYGIWRELREGREAARAAALPLCIDVGECTEGDIAGIGSVQLAQERLPVVRIRGCNADFKACFSAFGICHQCSLDAGTPCACKNTQSR